MRKDWHFLSEYQKGNLMNLPLQSNNFIWNTKKEHLRKEQSRQERDEGWGRSGAEWLTSQNAG